jgi:oxygen-independent coproporphyrinogen-3 oxidase
MEFGLYVHIPFCAARCPYCDFTITITPRRPEAEYSAALTAELRERWQTGPWPEGWVRSVYFGGGTPSLVDPAVIEAVLDEARRLGGDRFGPGEITLEANPEGLTPPALGRWRGSGVNRLSLGAQSFSARHLAFLGRSHRAPDIREAVQHARAAGFENLSMDLIFGMPGQTLEEVDSDLAQTLALGPPHVSVYNLTLEPRTAHYRGWKRGAFTLPEEEAQAAMFERVDLRLGEAGLGRYEISNFARPGFESVHNRCYWRRESYLGIGTGAHSCIADPSGGERWWNVRDHKRYIRQALAGKSCAESSERLTAEDARREWVFLSLRMADGFQAAEFNDRFGVQLEEAFPGVVDRLTAAGLLHEASGRVALTAKGCLLSNEAFLSFF